MIMNIVEQHPSSYNAENWRLLWKLCIPPKIQSLIWRACRDCLPTRTNLNTKGIICSPVCVICNKDLENTWHIFVSCPYAKQCWTEGNMLNIIEEYAEDAEGFYDWLFKILRSENRVNLAKFAAVLWGIWRQRNNKLWNDTILDCRQTVFCALDFLYNWLDIKKKGRGEKESNVDGKPSTIWKKPQPNFLKCNVDAAFFTETRSMGFGMVIRDHEGKIIGCRSMIFDGLCSVKEGEAMSLCEALSWIREIQFNRVKFEMDAQTVVRALKSSKNDESEFGSIVEDCRVFLQQEPSFSIDYISRLANTVAHALAKGARSYANPCTWSSPPTHIGDLVVRDALLSE